MSRLKRDATVLVSSFWGQCLILCSVGGSPKPNTSYVQFQGFSSQDSYPKMFLAALIPTSCDACDMYIIG